MEAHQTEVVVVAEEVVDEDFVDVPDPAAAVAKTVLHQFVEISLLPP
jgi:hypothetical protein